MSIATERRNRSAAQLRVAMRRWRRRAWIGAGFISFTGLILLCCWYLDSDPFWQVAGIVIMIGTLVGVCSDVKAYYSARQKVVQLETDI